MVKVRIEGKGWFAPTDVDFMDRDHKRRIRSGNFYPMGVHEIPEELVKYLPKSAQILDPSYKAPEPEKVDDITDISGVKAAADQEAAILKEAGVLEQDPPKRKRGRPRKNPETN